MQPVNEALLTDEEFLDVTAKKIETPINEQGSVTLNAETVQRLLDIIKKRDQEIQQLGFVPQLSEVIAEPTKTDSPIPSVRIPTLGVDKLADIPATCAEVREQNPASYGRIRTHFEKKGDFTYQLTLSIVNRPSVIDATKTTFEITREELTKQMDKFVDRPIGEINRDRFKNTREYDNVANWIKDFSMIDPSNMAGVLLSYELDNIRDFSKSIVITGTVLVTPPAAELIESGHIFAIRALLQAKNPNIPGSIVQQIIGFDLINQVDLDTTI